MRNSRLNLLMAGILLTCSSAAQCEVSCHPTVRALSDHFSIPSNDPNALRDFFSTRADGIMLADGRTFWCGADSYDEYINALSYRPVYYHWLSALDSTPYSKCYMAEYFGYETIGESVQFVNSSGFGMDASSFRFWKIAHPEIQARPGFVLDVICGS